MTPELPPLYGTAHGYACEAVEARERIMLEHIEMQHGRECVLLDKLTEFSNRIAELEAENSQLRTDIDDDTQLIRDLQAALDAAMAKGEKP